MRILIMGAPGSGKGTHAARVSEKFGLPAISTGAMLRAAITEDSDIGKEAAKYINNGNLVPDGVMINLVLDRINAPDCSNGYILDGFPRTLAQAEAMTEAGINVDTALMIYVKDEIIMERLGGRRACEKCGATYHLQYNPSKKGELCSVCSTKLKIRDDDKPETIRSRLEIYHKDTEPVINYYKNLEKLITVQGQIEVDDTTALVMEALEKRND